MKIERKLWLLVWSLVFCMVCALASASNVYLDEDFEGAAAFVDQNWPVKDNTGSFDTPGRAISETATLAAVKGINLRAYAGAAEDTAPKVSLTSQGAITPERFFLGSKSYKLNSGQSLSCAPGQFPRPHNNQFRLWQFAISTNAASAALPNGTRIGHFKIDQSTNGTDTTPEVTVQLNLVSNGAGVDLVCQNNSAKIGTLTGLAGNWALVTVVQYHNNADAVAAPASDERWRAVDFANNIVKGPNGTILDSQIPTLADTDNPNFYRMPFGMNFFVNSQTAPATTLNKTELGTAWGTDSTVGNSPQEVGWSFAAENNGVVYIDELQWDGCSYQNRNWGTVQEASIRLLEFDKATSEPTGPKEAESKTWTLY